MAESFKTGHCMILGATRDYLCVRYHSGVFVSSLERLDLNA
jgi:hypothetical protein